MFEVASSSEWAFASTGPPFLPNVFVDIDEFIDAKCQAMASYKSEARDFPHPRSEQALPRPGNALGSNVWARFGRGVSTGSVRAVESTPKGATGCSPPSAILLRSGGCFFRGHWQTSCQWHPPFASCMGGWLEGFYVFSTHQSLTLEGRGTLLWSAAFTLVIYVDSCR